MASWPVTVSDFKSYFNRDFVYGSGLNTVQDQDVSRGLDEAGMVFNTCLWATDTERSIAYLWASAHFLTINLQAAGGLAAVNTGRGVNSHGGGVIESKTVGGVSVNYALPDYVRTDKILSQFMQTNFGQTYLQFLQPRLVGNIATVAGLIADSAGFAGNVAQLVITTSSLAAGTNGVAYTQTLAATGGVLPLTWSVVSGTLPTGLSLSAALGKITGTPTVNGSSTFRIRATDSRGAVANMNYTVVVS